MVIASKVESSQPLSYFVWLSVSIVLGDTLLMSIAVKKK